MRNIFAETSEPAGADSPWFNLTFDVTASRELAMPERLQVEARGESDVGIAGFGIELNKSPWTRDQVSNDIWFDWGRGAIFSLGAESDRFAAVLSSLLGSDLPSRFVEHQECDVVLINSEPEEIANGYCRSKFFLGEADENEAQVFINLDVPEGRCEFREKDLDFRPALLRNLVIH